VIRQGNRTNNTIAYVVNHFMSCTASGKETTATTTGLLINGNEAVVIQ
jgi:hypothetical protein